MRSQRNLFVMGVILLESAYNLTPLCLPNLIELSMPKFIATCAKGLEYLLVDELSRLGAEEAKEGLSQVQFEADWHGVYEILMWSRIASRILFPIARFEAEDDDTLYRQCSIIDWSQHLGSGSTFLVNSQSYRSKLSHTQFISQRIKDAVVDYFKEETDRRPDVDFDNPDLSIHCRIRHNKVILAIDLAGAGLHQRGYRLQGGGAPIKENLAAALLYRAGWGKGVGALYDPMCGSGTFLIEAAMMAFDIAPGLNRKYLGVFGWQQFDKTIWDKVEKEAQERRLKGIEKQNIEIVGSDINPKAVRSAQMNISLAGLEEHIKVHIGGLDQVEQLDLPEEGLLMVNPPYSERLGEQEEVQQLYQQLGELLKKRFVGWKASVLSADKKFGHCLGIRAKKIYKFNNGSIPCELLNLELEPKSFVTARSKDSVETDFAVGLSDQAVQLKNRLEKNQAKLRKYIKRENIECYRVYDADLPEYNAAIDVYGDCLHLQEYRPPKSVDEKLALRRLKEIEKVSAGVFQIPRNKVFTKQRRQQKGEWQYQPDKDASRANSEANFFTVREGGRKFRINLSNYLDSGLFLDHRNTRAMIASKATELAAKAGRPINFLNLFCYTASVSVYAASVGAQTTNVDMSRTYLEWAKKNFEENKISLEQHQFIRDDCIAWLSQQSPEPLYDLIFLDPPTFSNSKKMEHHFDIQASHPELIKQCLLLLRPGGILFFSNNFQKFDMNVMSSQEIEVKEITRQTSTLDFSRKNLHRSWIIRQRDC